LPMDKYSESLKELTKHVADAIDQRFHDLGFEDDPRNDTLWHKGVTIEIAKSAIAAMQLSPVEATPAQLPEKLNSESSGSLIEAIKAERDAYGIMCYERIGLNLAIDIIRQHEADMHKKPDNFGISTEHVKSFNTSSTLIEQMKLRLQSEIHKQEEECNDHTLECFRLDITRLAIAAMGVPECEQVCESVGETPATPANSDTLNQETFKKVYDAITPCFHASKEAGGDGRTVAVVYSIANVAKKAIEALQQRDISVFDNGTLKRIIETAIYFTDNQGQHDDFSKHAEAVVDTIRPYLKTEDGASTYHRGFNDGLKGAANRDDALKREIIEEKRPDYNCRIFGSSDYCSRCGGDLCRPLPHICSAQVPDHAISAFGCDKKSKGEDACKKWCRSYRCTVSLINEIEDGGSK
jgi:hypothetical protein